MHNIPTDPRIRSAMLNVQAQKKLVGRIRDLGGDALEAEHLLRVMTETLAQMQHAQTLLRSRERKD